MTIHVRYKNFDQLSFADLLVYNKLPAHSFWSYVESKIDFSFADTLCAVAPERLPRANKPTCCCCRRGLSCARCG